MPEFGKTSGTQYPSRLLDQAHWFALKTRARHERKVVSRLEAVGIRTFGALVRVRREWTDRRKLVQVPLFPGYVFVHINLREPGEVLSRPGVVDFVRMRGVPQPVRTTEMDAVALLVRGATASGELPSHDDYLVAGTSVVVTEGPFSGLTGVLAEHRGATRVVVRLNSLRQARGVSIPTRYVKRTRPLAPTG